MNLNTKTFTWLDFQISTARMILLLIFGGFCSIVLLTHVLAKGPAARLKLLRWIRAVSSAIVFASPLSIMLSNLYIMALANELLNLNLPI